MMNKYAIKEIGRLGLGYKTFITKITQGKNGLDFETKMGDLKNGLDIYMWAEDKSCRWTIANFELDEKENVFELKEIGDRLCDPSMDWSAFGELVILGHDMLMRTEEELD